MPIKRSSLEQKWYYRPVKALFLILPLGVFLIVFLKGNINICNISQENIRTLFQNNVLYFVIGLLIYFLILEGIWRLFLYIIFGRLEADTKPKNSQASQSAVQTPQPASPAAQSVDSAAQPAPVKSKPTKKVGFCLIASVLVVLVIFALVLLGKSLIPGIDLSFLNHLLPTPGTSLPLGSGPEGYQYWQGDIPNSFYTLNAFGERGTQVTGKPYMILKYNNITNEITDLEFGLSEVTQVELAHSEGLVAAFVPLDPAGGVEAYKILDLKSPTVTLVEWYATIPSAGVEVGKKDLINGVQQFSFVRWGCGVGFGEICENWTFTYTNGTMTGGVTNLDTYIYMGNDSEPNAFNLLRIK